MKITTETGKVWCFMKTYIAIDDTDSLEMGATGQTANALRKIISERGWGRTQPVTRHQLLLHPDVPYTSHNSAMCFIAEISEDNLGEMIACLAGFLETSSAPGSDPGLCVAVDDRIQDIDSLMNFGFKAKTEVLNKQDAYETAQRCGIHLSEHGGTGQGIIGALAGIALRRTGNDGRFQGKIQLKNPGETIRVGEITLHQDIDEVQSIDGQILAADETVVIGDKIKTVLLDGKRKLLVYREDGRWHICKNQHLRDY